MLGAHLQKRKRSPKWAIAWLSNRLIGFRFGGPEESIRMLRKRSSDCWLVVSVIGLQGLAVRFARCRQGLRKMTASCWFAK